MFGKNRKKKVRLCLMVVAACLFVAGVWGILATPGTAWAEKGGKGGGGKNQDKPVEVPGCATFRDDSGDAVKSDGLGPYCEAEITLLVDKFGVLPDYHRFTVHPYNKRDLWFDFSNPKVWEGDVNEPPFTTGFVQLSQFGSTQSGPRVDLLSMKPDDPNTMRLWMKLRDAASNKYYLIYFGDTIYDGNVWSGSNSITVTAGPDTDNDGLADSWTFESTGAGSLVLYEKGGGQQTRKGLFNLPFAVTFVRD